MTDYNVMIYGRKVLDQKMKNKGRTFESLQDLFWIIYTSNNNNHLYEQSDAYPKAMEQVNFHKT